MGDHREQVLSRSGRKEKRFDWSEAALLVVQDIQEGVVRYSMRYCRGRCRMSSRTYPCLYHRTVSPVFPRLWIPRCDRGVRCVGWGSGRDLQETDDLSYVKNNYESRGNMRACTEAKKQSPGATLSLLASAIPYSFGTRIVASFFTPGASNRTAASSAPASVECHRFVYRGDCTRSGCQTLHIAPRRGGLPSSKATKNTFA